MHSMFVFLLWCKLIHVGILHVKVGWCGRVIQTISLDNAILFFPPNSLTRFPPWGDLSKNQSYATLDECYAWQIYADHTWVPNRKIWDFPLFARKKDVLSSLDVFRGGRFLFAVFLTRFFREFFKSFAQTCLGTNARPLVLFKCASGCMAPAKGCTMRDVNDWHHRS